MISIVFVSSFEKYSVMYVMTAKKSKQTWMSIFPFQARIHSGLYELIYISSKSLFWCRLNPALHQLNASMYSLGSTPAISSNSNILSLLLVSYSDFDSLSLLYFFMIFAMTSSSSITALTFFRISAYFFMYACFSSGNSVS